MRTKIAIITTDYLKDFINDVFDELNLDIETCMFIYHSYRDIEQLYQTIPPEYEGVMTSGIFPAAVIKKCFPDTKRCIGYFNTDDASICRLFLERFISSNSMKLSRVYGDFVEIFGISLEDYLTKEQPDSYTNLITPKVLAMSVEDICLMEERQLDKHIQLHQQGIIDFSVTRFSSIVIPLKERGFEVYFPYPSREFIRAMAEKLIQDINMRHMEDNRPAVVNVALHSEYLDEQTASFQLWYNSLEEALLDFHGSSFMDYIIQRTNTGFEVITNQKKIASYTENFTVCTLTPFLKKKLPFNVHVGYGVGKDIYQARMNAIHAEKEAHLHKSGSFLINENDELTGPLGEADAWKSSAYFPASTEAAAIHSGLSPQTVSRVFHAFQSMPEGLLTAGDLANKLSITKRSANRFLSALHKAAVIQIKTQKRPTSKGRPERVYELR